MIKLYTRESVDQLHGQLSAIEKPLKFYSIAYDEEENPLFDGYTNVYEVEICAHFADGDTEGYRALITQEALAYHHNGE